MYRWNEPAARPTSATNRVLANDRVFSVGHGLAEAVPVPVAPLVAVVPAADDDVDEVDIVSAAVPALGPQPARLTALTRASAATPTRARGIRKTDMDGTSRNGTAAPREVPSGTSTQAGRSLSRP